LAAAAKTPTFGPIAQGDFLRLQTCCTLQDSQPAQEIALRDRPEGRRLCRRRQCREVDMGAEVGLAGTVEDAGALVTAHRLQGRTRSAVVAIIDDQGPAAIAHETRADRRGE